MTWPVCFASFRVGQVKASSWRFHDPFLSKLSDGVCPKSRFQMIPFAEAYQNNYLQQKPGRSRGMTHLLKNLQKPLIISHQDITQPKRKLSSSCRLAMFQTQLVWFWGPALRMLTWLSWLQNIQHDIFTRFRLSCSMWTTCFGCYESVHLHLLTKMRKGLCFG